MRDEDGFSLVELMVVVVIIAVLIAVAIPTILGARTRSQDRAAHATLTTALTAEKVVYVDDERYSTDLATMRGIDPGTRWASIAVATADAVEAGDGKVVCLTVRSASGAVFGLKDIATGPNAGKWHYRRDISTACDNATADGTQGW